MSASLVGSEMCIRDRVWASIALRRALGALAHDHARHGHLRCIARALPAACLLYTSDAADDM
eukprot:10240134-Alexandrium_andersonii.AAC.1